MDYSIEYAGFSIRGPRRQRNEDNMLCGDHYLPEEHGDMHLAEDKVCSTDRQWMAVFDGIGGEAKGESASYLAAHWFAENGNHECDPEYAAASMNRDMLRFALKEKISCMGTTVCALHFAENAVTGFNVGDSRCYHLSDGRMERLSADHARYAGTPQHRLLTQYIGVDRSDFLITPHKFTREYRSGDIYMLCTDGVTDLIIDRGLRNILSAESTLSDKLDSIRKKLASRGTPDNATVILAKII